MGEKPSEHEEYENLRSIDVYGSEPIPDYDFHTVVRDIKEEHWYKNGPQKPPCTNFDSDQ